MQPTLFTNWSVLYAPDEVLFLHRIITDRWSKYSVTCAPLQWQQKPKELRKNITSHKFYKKATHNTYARRLQQEDWSVLEWKNDDGETGAWNCILRELKRANFMNWLVIVTRYYWWVHLNNDRFKHVIDATKMLIENIK